MKFPDYRWFITKRDDGSYILERRSIDEPDDETTYRTLVGMFTLKSLENLSDTLDEFMEVIND